MNKPIHLGLSILELSKIASYEFLYDYVKPKYGAKKLVYGYRRLYCIHKNMMFIKTIQEMLK